MSSEQVTVEIVDLADLKLDPQNAREHGETNLNQIADSLLDTGACRSIFIDEGNTTLGGNGVVTAARRSGAVRRVLIVDGAPDTLVAVRRSDLTPEQKVRAAVADNRTSETSTWNAAVLRKLQADGLLPVEKYWSVEEAAQLLNPAPEAPPLQDPGAKTAEAADLQVKWQTAVGQHWEWPSRACPGQSHHFYIRDAAAQLAEVLPNCALALTAPPAPEDDDDGAATWYAAVEPVIATLVERAEIVIWNVADLYCAGSQHTEPLYAYSVGLFAEYGWRPLWTRIWHKPVRSYGKHAYHLMSNRPVAEAAQIGAFAGPGAMLPRPEITADDYEWVMAFANQQWASFVGRLNAADRQAWGYAGIWELPAVKVAKVKGNPCVPFPLELPLRGIKMHTDPGALVGDPFLGTGTTAIACEQLGRRCIGLELDPRLMAVALQRMADCGYEPQLLR